MAKKRTNDQQALIVAGIVAGVLILFMLLVFSMMKAPTAMIASDPEEPPAPEKEPVTQNEPADNKSSSNKWNSRSPTLNIFLDAENLSLLESQQNSRLSDNFDSMEAFPGSHWVEVGGDNLYNPEHSQLVWNYEGQDGEIHHAILYSVPYEGKGFDFRVAVSATDHIGHFFLYFLFEDAQNWYRAHFYRKKVSESVNENRIVLEQVRDGEWQQIGQGTMLERMTKGFQSHWRLLYDPEAKTLTFFEDYDVRVTVPVTLGTNRGYFGMGGVDRRPVWDDFEVRPFEEAQR